MQCNETLRHICSQQAQQQQFESSPSNALLSRVDSVLLCKSSCALRIVSAAVETAEYPWFEMSHQPFTPVGTVPLNINSPGTSATVYHVSHANSSTIPSSSPHTRTLLLALITMPNKTLLNLKCLARSAPVGVVDGEDSLVLVLRAGGLLRCCGVVFFGVAITVVWLLLAFLFLISRMRSVGEAEELGFSAAIVKTYVMWLHHPHQPQYRESLP